MHLLFYKLSSHLKHVLARYGMIKHQKINHIYSMLIWVFVPTNQDLARYSDVCLVSTTENPTGAKSRCSFTYSEDRKTTGNAIENIGTCYFLISVAIITSWSHSHWIVSYHHCWKKSALGVSVRLFWLF